MGDSHAIIRLPVRFPPGRSSGGGVSRSRGSLIVGAVLLALAVLCPWAPVFAGLPSRLSAHGKLASPAAAWTKQLAVALRARRDAPAVEFGGSEVDEEEQYVTENVDEDAPTDSGDVLYFAASDVQGAPIFRKPGGEIAGRLSPGDFVAAESEGDGTYVRLLDNRGWLKLDSAIEEVDPWLANVMKKPGIDKTDAASLAYLSMDMEDMPPLAEHLPLPRRVITAMENRGIVRASPIQEAVFERIHRGESLCLQSQTGSGKTLAMLLPLLTAMSEDTVWSEQGDKVVVVTSTRELAVQIFSDVEDMNFFPRGQGHAILLIVGNLPATKHLLKANIIIGTANELGGVLHKTPEIVKQLSNQLRAIVLDEVDKYTTCPKLHTSPWQQKRLRRKYNEAKMSLQLIDESGKIEWFMRRSLAYARRRDLQVLAGSATLSRDMARKVHRMLRWDPLGRWYRAAPPLVRPLSATNIDFQATPRVPAIPQNIDHRFVQVIKAWTNTTLDMENPFWTRMPWGKGGLPNLYVRSGTGKRKILTSPGKPVSEQTAGNLIDGLHDALKSRGPGSCMVIVTKSAGINLRELVGKLHAWGFHEAQSMNTALWDDPEDWMSRWAIKYSYDQADRSPELAQNHANLAERIRTGQPFPYPMGSHQWRALKNRREAGETVAPILVGFEELSRGVHFDGIESVYVLGLPRKPDIYLHIAGRAGRLGQKGGKVISVVPFRGVKVLNSWAKQIGPDVKFSAEPITRNLSAPLIEKDRLPARRKLTKEEVRVWREEIRQEELLQAEAQEEGDVDGPRLLTDGDDYTPVPGSLPEDDARDQVRELQRIRKEDAAARAAARQLDRITSPY